MFLEIKIYVALLIFVNAKTTFADDKKAPIVILPHGIIQGHVLQSPVGRKAYYAYQDIPYAAPPVGKLRFKEPVEPEDWSDVLDTSKNTHSCYLSGQESEIAPGVTQSEDCLYLNVYTPVDLGNGSSPPVLFWIHGGGFYFGDGTFQVYGPQYLIDYDVVIVTINYRLGAFGFLTTQDDVIPGNLGLKDQNLALKWVKTNIGLFGGDPERVTIVGESAGGASVGYQLISKKSKGLFRGAVLQSGTAICSFSYQGNPKYYAFKMGNILNEKFTSDNSTELLEVLQNASAEDINKVTDFSWAPVIENSDYDGAFITGSMYDSIKTGDINQVPIMIGFNSEEDLVFINAEGSKEMAAGMDKDPSKVVNDMYDMKDDDKSTAGQMLKQLYTTGSFQDNFGALVRYMTDSSFTTPIIRHAELQSNYADVYLYQFAYKGMMGCTNITVEGAEAVGHAEDLKYLWHIDRLDDGSIFSPADRLTQSRLLKLWSNFVKYLNPTPESDPLFNGIIWPKVNSDINRAYLNINRTLEVKTGPRQYKDFTAIVDKYAGTSLITY